jgi:adenosine 3'-phospho 5'-phosphosulfate transporter B2
MSNNNQATDEGRSQEEMESLIIPLEVVNEVTKAKKDNETLVTALTFLGCFVGLQSSYLVWGIMQEMIMNSQYEPSEMNPSGKFPSATFCVFSNRFLAIIVAGIICWFVHGTVRSDAPFLAFTPCALSNTISSWGQYQALSYVSFSLQTLFKATKVIPVMLMGKVLKGTDYSITEYIEAAFITIGVAVFSTAKSAKDADEKTTQFYGFILLCLYITSDSFTAQWQSRVYRDYGKIDQFHMMFGVNISAILITSFALVVSGEIPLVIDFFSHNPSTLWYNILTAITSTTGQLCIYFTIKRFGPIVFTIIMTTRQMLSIVVSNMLFGHVMSFQSYVGALIVFTAVFHSIYQKMKKNNKSNGNNSSTVNKL